MNVRTRRGLLRAIRQDSVVSRSLERYGEWAQLEIDVCADFLMPGDTVIDAGAFIGTHSLEFSHLVGQNGRVLAFEARKPFASVLKFNCRRSPFKNIQIFNCALGAQSESIGLPLIDIGKELNFGAMSLRSLNSMARRKETVHIKPLDSFSIDQLNFLKADVEGMEAEVLRGAASTLTRCRPVVLLEVISLENGSPVLDWARTQDYVAFGFLTLAYNSKNFAGNTENIFGEACESSLLLIPGERLSNYINAIEKHRLVRLLNVDDLSLLLLHKPQYPQEVLATGGASQILGISYRSPLAYELQEAISEREHRLVQLSEALSHRDRSLGERDTLIASVSAAVAQKDATLAERDTQLRILTEVLSQRDAAHSQRELQIAELAAMSADLNKSLAERNSQVLSLASEVSQRDANLMERAAQLAELTEKLEQQQQAISDLSDHLSRRDTIIADRDSQVAGLTAELRRQDTVVSQGSDRIAELSQAVLALDGQIAALLHSRSWRITRPIRFLFGKARLLISQGTPPAGTESAGVAELSPTPPLSSEAISHAEQNNQTEIINVANQIREYFDADYYLRTYPDVAEAGIDPVEHYVRFGASEFRDPRPDFSTRDYLDHNPDVRAVGINAFLHYILAGRREGRLCIRPGGFRARHLDTIRSLEHTIQDWRHLHRNVALLDVSELISEFERILSSHSGGAALGFSHDDYTVVSGGVQLCLLIEQAAFQSQDIAYINLHPVQPLPTLARDLDELSVNILCDGELVGAARINDVADAVSKVKGFADSLLIVHAVHGHAPEAIERIAKAAGVRQAFFWLHDYMSICPGYTLLRNGISFCGAPPIDSPACRICVFGEARPEHAGRIASLFNAIPFTVVSPSASALEIWKSSTSLPYEGTLTHPHCQLRASEQTETLRTAGPVRIAFLGYPVFLKGWPVFETLVARFSSNETCQFYYLGAHEPKTPGLTNVNVTVSRQNRTAMIRAVAENEIDFAVLWSLCPETFSFTSLEAIAGGAHVITSNRSGNIAQIVRSSGKGIVFENETDLVAFFASGEAQRYAQERRRPLTVTHELIYSRMSADLIHDYVRKHDNTLLH